MSRTERRKARKYHRCESCLKVIAPGSVYLFHVQSPYHGDFGGPTWEQVAECSDCATRYGRGDLLVAS